MNEAQAVAGWLAGAGIAGVCACAPSALACPEPVVCLLGAWERAARTHAIDRGVRTVEVIVCREIPAQAEAAAFACQDAVEATDWGQVELDGGAAVRGVDTGIPVPAGCDGSGRLLWRLDVRVTVEREVEPWGTTD